MDSNINLFLENIFDAILKQKDLLKQENKKVILAILYDVFQKHRNIFENKIAQKDPSEEEIMRVFFNNMDLSKFNKCNSEEMAENIKTIITIWEQRKK